MSDHTNKEKTPEPRLTGYARVSTEDQNLNLQVDALQAFGVEPARICTDKMTGAKMTRPGLQKAIDISQRGDTLIVYKLDRLGRSLKGVLEVIELLEKYGVELKSLTEPIDSTTPMGRMVMNMLLSFAQMERDLISERTKAGMAAARARGETTGPKHFVKDHPKRLRRFTELWAAGEVPERMTAKQVVDEMHRVQKHPPIKSQSAYYNWKAKGFAGFVPPPDEDLKGKD